jgi:hypothetical protein
MAGVGAIFNVLGDRASALGKIIFEAFDDPQQAVKDLWEVIKTNLLNRIKGVGETFKALGGLYRHRSVSMRRRPSKPDLIWPMRGYRRLQVSKMS